MSNEQQVTLEHALEIAKQHHQAGNLTLAETTYRDIIAVMPENFTSLYQLGFISYQQQKLDEAIKFIKKALEIAPDRADAHNAYGVMLEQKGDTETAIQEWNKAIEIDPNCHDAYINITNAHWKNQNYEESCKYGKKAIDINPNAANGYINYGAALVSSGKTEEAIEAWKKALTLHEDHPNALINLGNSYREIGELAKSEEYCKRALEVAPNDPASHMNMGSLLLDQSHTDEAEKHYRTAIQFKPDYVEAHNNISLVMMYQLKFDEAAAAARMALAFDPENIEALNYLSAALRQLNQFQEAEITARKALNLQPDSIEAKINLADTLFLSDRNNEAETLLEEIQEKESESARIFIKLSSVQERLNKYDEALTSIEKAKELAPEMPEIHLKKGSLLMVANKVEDAISSYEKALELNPEYPQAFSCKSEALQALGKMEESKQAIDQGISINNNLPSLYLTMAKVHKFTETDPHFIKMQELYKNSENMGSAEAAILNFALFKAYQDIKDYKNAFEHLKKGNDFKRSTAPFDKVSQKEHFQSIPHVCTPNIYEQFKGKGHDSDIPVFIIGMPRSGTTLTEQIISSHPEAYGAGELYYLSDLENKFGSTSINNAKEMGKQYTRMVQNLHADAAKAKRVTDKMPGNYARILQIISILPNAKIIHCKRNPVDTALSCYKQLFARGQYWSYKLDELAEHYALYEMTMKHFKENFGNHFIEINYEDTVTDFETQARRLIDYVDLEWHEACLEPHKQKRSVLTASKAQVVKPIYKTSVEAWKRYETQMQPFIDSLEKYREKYVS